MLWVQKFVLAVPEHEFAKSIRRTQEWLEPVCKRLILGCRASEAILSVGCGNGGDVLALRKLGYCAFGLDPAVSFRSEANQWITTGISQNLPFPDSFFGVVVMLEVLEHIGAIGFSVQLEDGFQNKRDATYDELMRITRQGGGDYYSNTQLTVSR